MLLPVRILSFLLVLILIAQILPSTSSYQGGKTATKRCKTEPKREPLANSGEEHQAAVIRANQLKGPRVAYTEKVMIEKSSVEIATQERVGLNVASEQIMSRRPLSQSGGKDSAGYVAFTADYKSPRHHPPRHN